MTRTCPTCGRDMPSEPPVKLGDLIRDAMRAWLSLQWRHLSPARRAALLAQLRTSVTDTEGKP